MDPGAFATVVFFGGATLAMLAGGLVGWIAQFNRGAAVALLGIGASGLAAAGHVWYHGAPPPADARLPVSGEVLAFLIFGGLPALMGGFFVLDALLERAEARRPASGARAVRARRPGRADDDEAATPAARVALAGGHAGLLGGMVYMAVAGGDTAAVLGRGFMFIGAGVLFYAIAFARNRTPNWRAAYGCVVIGAGFLAFGALAWGLAGRA